MNSFLMSILLVCLLVGCNQALVTQESPEHKGYFADAFRCNQSSMRKESVNVPTAGSMSVVEVPMGYDAGKFTVCMQYAKRPVSRADASEYLKVSSNCLQVARGSDNPDQSYSDCLKNSRLNLQIEIDP